MGADEKLLYGLSVSTRMFLGGLMFSLLVFYLTKPFFCGIDNFQSKKDDFANWFKKGIKKGTDFITTTIGIKNVKTEKKKKKKEKDE